MQDATVRFRKDGPSAPTCARTFGASGNTASIWRKCRPRSFQSLCPLECPCDNLLHVSSGYPEKAAEVERKKPARPYDDLPVLPDALKQQLSSLLSTATKLERDYQAILNAAGPAAPPAPPAAWLLPLGRLHVQWEADLTAFRSALLGAGVSQKSQDMILPGIEGMAQQIGRLKARLQAS